MNNTVSFCCFVGRTRKEIKNMFINVNEGMLSDDEGFAITIYKLITLPV